MTKKELFNLLYCDGMDLVVYVDGELESVPSGSSYFEKELRQDGESKIPLDKWYWRDSFENWELLDDEGNVKEAISDEKINDFINQAFEEDELIMSALED